MVVYNWLIADRPVKKEAEDTLFGVLCSDRMCVNFISYKQRVCEKLTISASIYKSVFIDFDYLIYSDKFVLNPYYIINEDYILSFDFRKIKQGNTAPNG